MDDTGPYTTRRSLATVTRPATSYLTDLLTDHTQRLHRRRAQRLEARASRRRRPARRPRPHQPFTPPPSRPPAIWHIETAELTNVLEDSWH